MENNIKCPRPLSHITGGTIEAKIFGDIKWNDGLVGSHKHKVKMGVIEDGEGYIYSDVFLVPEAGTTLYFFDTPGKNDAGVEFAGNTVYVFSNWKEVGGEWLLDGSKRNVFGAQQVSYEDAGEYRMFSYTTLEDNAAIRICCPKKSEAPKVWFSVKVDVVGERGREVKASYKNAEGADENYSIYLPLSYGRDVLKTVFCIGGGRSIAEAVIGSGEDVIVVSYDNKDNALSFIDAIVRGYKLSPELLYLVGDIEAEGVFRACVSDESEYADADAAAKALLSAEPEYFYDVLKNAVMYAMGDSYIHARELGTRNSWVNRMGDKYCMDYFNYGISGSTVSNLASGNPMFIRIKEMGDKDADIIIIEGGRNDVSHDRALGEADSRDPETIVGAFNVMIDHCLEKYPRALIVTVTPWYNTIHIGKESGVSNLDAANAIVGAVEARADKRVVCIYAADREKSGIDMNDADCRRNFAVDGGISHLNLAGMKRVQPYFESVIAAGVKNLKN